MPDCFVVCDKMYDQLQMVMVSMLSLLKYDVELVHSDLSAQRGIKFINEKPCIQNFIQENQKLQYM